VLLLVLIILLQVLLGAAVNCHALFLSGKFRLEELTDARRGLRCLRKRPSVRRPYSALADSRNSRMGSLKLFRRATTPFMGCSCFCTGPSKTGFLRSIISGKRRRLGPNSSRWAGVGQVQQGQGQNDSSDLLFYGGTFSCKRI
jgi:hypothetical protein